MHFNLKNFLFTCLTSSLFHVRLSRWQILLRTKVLNCQFLLNELRIEQIDNCKVKICKLKQVCTLTNHIFFSPFSTIRSLFLLKHINFSQYKRLTNGQGAFMFRTSTSLSARGYLVFQISSYFFLLNWRDSKRFSAWILKLYFILNRKPFY